MVTKATIHESASSSRSDNSFNSVTVSFCTDGSSELSLTHRMERSREDDTPLVKQVSVSSYTCRDVASARPHDSDPLSLARSWKSVFLKDRKSAGGMSYRTLGGRAVHFQIISKPAEKYMKREKLSWILCIAWILFIQASEIESFSEAVLFILFFIPEGRSNTSHVLSFGDRRLQLCPAGGGDPPSKQPNAVRLKPESD